MFIITVEGYSLTSDEQEQRQSFMESGQLIMTEIIHRAILAPLRYEELLSEKVLIADSHT